jgi:ElaB/YqjD/DUF883 family membrane-anchored ribosome-binding protein
MVKLRNSISSTTRGIAENERLQQSVDVVLQRTKDLAESERVQSMRQKAVEVIQNVQETTKVVSEKVTERTQQGVEYAKDTSNRVRQGATTVWEQGRGQIQKARSNVSTLAWKGSAHQTLNMAEREEQWKGIKIRGAEEIVVPARTEHTSVYHVQKGTTLRWTFRVKDNDIGFGTRVRVQAWGGSKEEEVLAVERYDSADTISGSWVADEERTMVLVFDNTYSRLRSKTIAFLVGSEIPPADGEGAEPPATSVVMASEPAASSATAVAVPVPVAVPAENDDAAEVEEPTETENARAIV